MKVAWSPTGSRGYQMNHVAVDREDLYVSAYAGVENVRSRHWQVQAEAYTGCGRAAWYMYYCTLMTLGSCHTSQRLELHHFELVSRVTSQN